MKSSRKSGLAEKMPKVSVIIPVYNGEKFLSEAIESVVAQTYLDWEIITVNDGSTDRSLEILRKYEKQLPSKIYVINQENKGPSLTRNMAIAEAKGEYIAFLDCDDSWLPEKLEKQVEFLDLNKEFGLIYSDCYVIDYNGNIKGNTYSSRIKPFRGNVFNELLYTNFIPTSTVMVRSEVFDDVGLFNPMLRISQDYDLWIRIAETCPIDFIDQPLAKYRLHCEGISRNVELMTNEDFQIMEYWLTKKPKVRRELKDQIKQKRARLHYQLALYYYHNRKIRKAIAEFITWTFYKSTLSRN